MATETRFSIRIPLWKVRDFEMASTATAGKASPVSTWKA
eukprot:CAMPEP_0197673386 /NCGR_PEP_ID=MMETSP1338-20131121/80840_1 /TAXON_ID=43686 ORGANISM="Pelagodinium beii, Strain RCC1491" /NCGR_SAMPLE_ID=MMETSP1338 /ASSEMBLY_ACC=CAM_ASM_000754 /LENGTH=38 /DNA_ID= /DNA_START= /DNA_END= /DNA_ORIENTATION=